MPTASGFKNVFSELREAYKKEFGEASAELYKQNQRLLRELAHCSSCYNTMCKRCDKAHALVQRIRKHQGQKP